MNKPQLIHIQNVAEMNGDTTVVWCIPEVKEWASKTIPFRLLEPLRELPPEVSSVVVIGGGVLLDEAKVFRRRNRPDLTLIAIPSIWGSGSEVSPVAVLNREGKKVIENDPELLPDFRVVCHDLAQSVPEGKATIACGDVWAHAMEAFLSPLASDELREEVADLIRSMMQKAPGNDPEWFELSARACQAQVQSSVGLVHGMAHVLEGILREKYPEREIGHALLCSVLLWPVMSFNCMASDKMPSLLSQYRMDSGALFEVFKGLFDLDVYDLISNELPDNWKSILRDRCTRTNCALVRPDALDYFARKEFL